MYCVKGRRKKKPAENIIALWIPGTFSEKCFHNVWTRAHYLFIYLFTTDQIGVDQNFIFLKEYVPDEKWNRTGLHHLSTDSIMYRTLSSLNFKAEHLLQHIHYKSVLFSTQTFTYCTQPAKSHGLQENKGRTTDVSKSYYKSLINVEL